ncbi:hypothetical protein B1219_18255 [Pseudomonas ogarae]|uniref:TetR/AcrR family transcriptional regulator n=1 Tax=Pseudomonas ogarae (strain DSM 112162 / CECT 30235 / F113) TaxID=1114970 RepID=UPI0009A29F75|nr:TetR/AcrR family transcriptional regulator [Pseudomonas ogarae]OPG72101.1 hypothetical protein B1219_18255 [Pseudomonas ogarae]
MTFNAILESAERLFARDGFEASSTTKIAEFAGVSVGSLYEYFPSKDALVAQLLKRHCDRMLEQFARAFFASSGRGIEEVAGALVDAAHAAYAIDVRLHRVLLEQMGRVSKPHHMSRVSLAIVDLLEKALIECGEVIQRPGTRLAAFMVESVVESLMQRSIQYAPEVFEADLREELKVMVTLYLRTSPSSPKQS